MADSTCASEPGVSPLKNSHPGVSASGQMAFTRIPTRPHSNAVTRVSTRIASLAIAYPLIAGWGRIDEPELRLITHPRLARSASWAACITRKVPHRARLPHRIHVVLGDLAHGLVHERLRVVHDDVEMTEGGERRSDHRVHLLTRLDITSDRASRVRRAQ